MIKRLLWCAAMATAVVFTACDKKASDSDVDDESDAKEIRIPVNVKISTMGDSIAHFSGIENGYNLNSSFQNMPEEFKKDFNKKAFVDGIVSVMKGDTTESYLQGLGYGLQLMQQVIMYGKAGIGFNRDAFLSEFKKAFEAGTVDNAALDSARAAMVPLQDRASTIVQDFQTKEMQRQQEETIKKMEENKEAGAAFLKKKTASDPGIVVTPSGLAYKINKRGNGSVARPGDNVRVIYTGRLIDGTEFDSSKGQPVQFNTNQVVPGFAEALTTLPAGTKATVYIPENLGYGSQPAGKIEPGSTLVFDIEIVG